jgi:hypothetical protein
MFIDKGRRIALCFRATFRDEYFPGVGPLAPLYFKLAMIWREPRCRLLAVDFLDFPSQFKVDLRQAACTMR